MKSKWYSCSYCQNKKITPDLYVGDVLDSSESMTMKPVKLWDMSKPKPIAELLRNRYETGMFGKEDDPMLPVGKILMNTLNVKKE